MKKSFFSKSQQRENISGFLFLLPNLIGFLIFSFLPVASAFYISLTNWDGINKMKFIGVSNYIELFQHDTFWIAFWNTIVYTITSVPATIILGLLVATLLNQKLKGTTLYRMIYFMPYIASGVAVAYIFSALLHPTMGPVNGMLQLIGVDNPPSWLTDAKWAMFSVVIMSIWKNFGYYVVIFLAGLQGISKTLYEAATIDGANRWHQFKSITVPMLAPVTFFSLIMATIGSFKVFDQIFILTEGGPGRATTTMVQYIYQNSFLYYKMGFASAGAVTLFGLIFLITLVQYRGQNKWVNY